MSAPSTPYCTTARSIRSLGEGVEDEGEEEEREIEEEEEGGEGEGEGEEREEGREEKVEEEGTDEADEGGRDVGGVAGAGGDVCSGPRLRTSPAACRYGDENGVPSTAYSSVYATLTRSTAARTAGNARRNARRCHGSRCRCASLSSNASSCSAAQRALSLRSRYGATTSRRSDSRILRAGRVVVAGALDCTLAAKVLPRDAGQRCMP
jgi:hypothetical protein